MENNVSLLLKYFWVLIAFTIFSACKQDKAKLLDLGEASIRIINAVPENTAISVKLNDSLKTPQVLNFSQIASYQKIAAGYKVINTNSNRLSITNANLKLLFKNKKNYSVFIAGKISKDSLVYIVLEDNLTSPSDTTVKVRFVNTCPNSPSLEAVFSTNVSDSVASFSSTTFRASTVYQLFKAGNYVIKIRQAGSKQNLALGANFKIIAGRVYTIWVKGLLNGTGEYQLNPALLTDN